MCPTGWACGASGTVLRNAARRSWAPAGSGARGGSSPRTAASITSTTAVSAKSGTTMSASSWQVTAASRVRPTLSRAEARRLSRSRARSRSVTSTTAAARPSTVPWSFCKPKDRDGESVLALRGGLWTEPHDAIDRGDSVREDLANEGFDLVGFDQPVCLRERAAEDVLYGHVPCQGRRRVEAHDVQIGVQQMQSHGRLGEQDVDQCGLQITPGSGSRHSSPWDYLRTWRHGLPARWSAGSLALQVYSDSVLVASRARWRSSGRWIHCGDRADGALA